MLFGLLSCFGIYNFNLQGGSSCTPSSVGNGCAESIGGDTVFMCAYDFVSDESTGHWTLTLPEEKRSTTNLLLSLIDIVIFF